MGGGVSNPCSNLDHLSVAWGSSKVPRGKLCPFTSPVLSCCSGAAYHPWQKGGGVPSVF